MRTRYLTNYVEIDAQRMCELDELGTLLKLTALCGIVYICPSLNPRSLPDVCSMVINFSS